MSFDQRPWLSIAHTEGGQREGSAPSGFRMALCGEHSLQLQGLG